MSESTGSHAPRGVKCESHIVEVVVHGRGAVVTREVVVTEALPSTAVELQIPGITPLADPGSLRVMLADDARALVSIDSRLVVPEDDTGPGDSVKAVEEMQRQLDALAARKDMLQRRVARLREFEAAPFGRRTVREEGPANRLDLAVSLNQVATNEMAKLDEQIVQLEIDETLLREQFYRRALEDEQTSSADRMGDGHPTRLFALLLGAGDAAVERFTVSYVVPYAAKWWPVYSLRLRDGGKSASLTFEAVVAQRTGEDWTDVKVGVATSEIVFDATLPRLPSLRLGKQQREQRSGFRAPPAGVDRLFHSYDAFQGRLEPLGETTRELAALGAGGAAMQQAPPPPPMLTSAPMSPPAAAPRASGWSHVADDAPEADLMLEAEVPQESAPMMMRKMAKARGGGFGAAVGGAISDGIQALGEAAGYGGGGYPGAPPPLEPSYDPGTDWLEFDALVLAGADRPQRGRLQRRPRSGSGQTSELYDAHESARRMNLVDPTVSRGLFDYRYDSDGLARVPADGRLHRFELLTADASSELVWRTVPIVDPQVYREALFHNPFSSPLLSGPIDVFSEGQLVTTTRVKRVDSGGSMRVGLGVDERIRVARNVRMVEESAGLLGGKRELIHDVEIELRSNLGFDATVEVVDRVPVTSDDEVGVDVLGASTGMKVYDQEEIEHPVKGGRCWSVTLPAGARETIELRYQITLRSKDELQGGNRRD